jgi:hypothetical protein
MPLSTETETVNEMTDYDTLAKEMKESGNFWKAPEGKTVVVPLTEMSAPKKETINGKESMRCELKINVNGTEKIWGMTFGGSGSTYGKLVAIGQKHKTLVGVPIEIIRQGMDKENTKYIILDASK